ncbi:beta-propeller fold lactonase family protein [Devosia ginsengisoli]|uniref:beta-propeller fold lactonase family protein n=1 Tax=Devosia ginsengisoli TaxID=400770 RepID=UPI0026EAC588|nr:beta-propeller fold lactonase family protein [Devosia ginsengisoli]MCR6669787.1 hypothetical protein [Devosia ginsengisoli]
MATAFSAAYRNKAGIGGGRMKALGYIMGCLLAISSIQQAQAAGTGYVFVSNEVSNTVTVLDGETLEKVTDIPTAARPRWLAFSPDQELLYVACGDDSRLDV